MTGLTSSRISKLVTNPPPLLESTWEGGTIGSPAKGRFKFAGRWNVTVGDVIRWSDVHPHMNPLVLVKNPYVEITNASWTMSAHEAFTEVTWRQIKNEAEPEVAKVLLTRPKAPWGF